MIGTVRLWATGYTEFTVGNVVSAVVPVVKVHGFGAVALLENFARLLGIAKFVTE